MYLTKDEGPNIGSRMLCYPLSHVQIYMYMYVLSVSDFSTLPSCQAIKQSTLKNSEQNFITYFKNNL